MDTSWTSFVAAASAIGAVFGVAIWRQLRRNAALVVTPEDGEVLAPPPVPSHDLLARRAALEELLATAPTAGGWDETAPLAVLPDDPAFAPTMPSTPEHVD